MQAETTNPEAQQQAEIDALEKLRECAQEQIKTRPEGSGVRAMLEGLEGAATDMSKSRGASPSGI